MYQKESRENEMNKIIKEMPQDFKELTDMSFCNQQKYIHWKKMTHIKGYHHEISKHWNNGTIAKAC